MSDAICAIRLSRQQAADAVRGRLDWKYLRSLELTDPGFDASVLCEFRQRLIDGKAEQQVLQPLLDEAAARGWIKPRGKQRTDSTHVLGAIRTLHRLETVEETMRATLNVLATVAGEWLRTQAPVEWVDRYEKRFEAYRLPKGKTERQQYAQVIGADGLLVLSLIYSDQAPSWLREIPMVQILRQVWVQQYCASDDGQAIFRTDEDVAPSAIQIHAPYDAEARFSTKRDILWAGYTVHLTETCDEDLPHLITHMETTAATSYDGAAVETIHAALEAKGLLPDEHIVDSGYLGAEVLASAERNQGITLLGLVPEESSWQARLRQKAPDFKAKYAKRAGIEGTISQGVRGFDLRHARYKG